MKKNIIPIAEIPELTIGLDLSDRTFRFCELNAKGEIINEGQAKLDPPSLKRYLASRPVARVALETGGHSAWVRQVIEQIGHQALWPTHASSKRSPAAASAPTITTRGNWLVWRESIASC